ncbi:TetR/AcrR family transcriptional regulator [Klenkia taihuensis]|uniref:TetR/AcrR family transcriptional regulator n=1 Tax=Klenkia taihuensis TaxID=1225127 RepID=UPI0013F5C178|nr:TetR/AcrR family transcriptional regulator [Klenkia taihuensis]
MRGGRPRDEELTTRLLAVAVDVLAEGGLSLLTIERVASRAGAGRAGVYRRWPDMPHLAADAVRTCSLVPRAPSTASLAGDLATVLHPWTRDLDRGERAAAALLGEARTSLVVQGALDEVVRWPLSGVLARVVGAERARGRAVPTRREGTADRVLRALWWSRYVDQPDPLSGREVEALVGQVFVPLLDVR